MRIVTASEPLGRTSAGRGLGVLALAAPVLLVVALAVLVDATDLTIGSIAEHQLLYEIVLRLPIQLVVWLLLAAVVAGSGASGDRYNAILTATAASVAVVGLGGVAVVSRQNALSVNDTTALLAAYSRLHVALLCAVGLVGAALVWWLARSRTVRGSRRDALLLVFLTAGASLVLLGGVVAAATVVAAEDAGPRLGGVMQLLSAADGPAFGLFVLAALVRRRIDVPGWVDRWLLAALGLLSAILAVSAVERILDLRSQTPVFLSTAQNWALLAENAALLVVAVAVVWWLIRRRRSDLADDDVLGTDRLSRVFGIAALVVVVAAVAAAAIAGGLGIPAGSGTGPLPSPSLAERAYVLVGPLTYAFLLVLAAVLLPMSRNDRGHPPSLVRYAAVTVSVVAVGAAGVFAVHALSGRVDTFVLDRQSDRLYVAQLAAITAVSSALASLTGRPRRSDAAPTTGMDARAAAE